MSYINKDATLAAIANKAKEELSDANHYFLEGVQLAVDVVEGMPETDNLVKDSQVLAKDLVNDCISRQAAIDAIKKCRNESDMPDMWYDGMSCALRCIYQLSSSQPKSYREGYQTGFKDAQTERKRGKWGPWRCDMYKCSECGYIYTELSIDRCEANYCPHCGAKMEVDDGSD